MSFIDSHVEYGCWISPENSVENRAPKLGEKALSAVGLDSTTGHEIYADLYRAGYVEVRYVAGSIMEVWGVAGSIGRSRELWGRLAASVKSIKLCMVRTDSESPQILDHEVGFDYPAEMSEMDNYLGIC